MSKDVSDAQEFDAIPREGLAELSEAVERLRNTGSSPTPAGLFENKKAESDIPVGHYVQFARNGPGYVAATQTLAKLPAGIYSFTVMNHQLTYLPHRVVTDTLLRLPDSRSDEVIVEIERFWKMKPTFQKFGFTHKRGFLLYGPQGSGKTSTVNVVMQEMVARDGLVFIVGGFAPEAVVTLLKNLREADPDRPVVVILEDIDTYIQSYGQNQVLSILDGEDSIDNCVYIATTNYPERLEPRVVNRPSRFDRVVKIDTPNAAARKMYLESRGLGIPEAEIDRWVAHTERFSIAHLKELVIGVLGYGNKFEDEIERLRAMAKLPKSDEPYQKAGFAA